MHADISLYCKHRPSDQGLFDAKLQQATILKVRILFETGELETAQATVEQVSETCEEANALRAEIKNAKTEHAKQEKAMFKKMIAGKQKLEPSELKQAQESLKTELKEASEQ